MRIFLICLLLIRLEKHCTVASIVVNKNSKASDIKTRSFATEIEHIEEIHDIFTEEPNTVNFTKEQLATLLKQYGYPVVEGPKGWPLGMVDDVAFNAEDLLPELGALHGRRNLEVRDRLWLDDDKETIIPYYFDNETKADEKTFEDAVKSWSDSTCIKFSKKPPNICSADIGEPAVCVGDFGGCWSSLGRNYGSGKNRGSQKMSVQPGGCENVAAAHEFGHALGFLHEMARPDRDKYINVQFENIEVKLEKLTEGAIRHSWSQAGKFCMKDVFDAPKPYDSMSLMQYATSSFAGLDQRPVYLHKNPHYQYMFDYHRPGGYMQTHYDKMVINLGYKCVSKWRKSCEESGKSVPKCQNHGYAGPDCKCICPKGYTGNSCGTKDGPIFPVLDRAKAMLDISKPGLVDMKGKGMHDENHNYPRADFVTCQFITVIIKSGDETRISVDVDHDFAPIKKNFDDTVDMWIYNGLECQYGLHVYIGHAEVGKMRVESISSLVNNEPQEYRPVLRSKTNELDIIGMGGWTLSFSGGATTVRKAMQFKFTVSFHDRPEDKLSVVKKNPGTVVATARDAQKMVQKALNSNRALVLVVPLVLVLAGLAAAYACRAVRRLKEEVAAEEENEKALEEEGSNDESQSSDSSDESETKDDSEAKDSADEPVGSD